MTQYFLEILIKRVTNIVYMPILIGSFVELFEKSEGAASWLGFCKYLSMLLSFVMFYEAMYLFTVYLFTVYIGIINSNMFQKSIFHTLIKVHYYF